MAIGAVGMFNVTNRYTFSAIVQRALGDISRVPVPRRQLPERLFAAISARR